MDIEKIAGFVATEIHGMCSWTGETINVWAKFDCDPRVIPLGKLREHLVSAVRREPGGEKPEGFISATAFISKNI